MKGKIAKVLTFLVVIGLVTSMAMINNILPIKVAKNVQNIEQQEPAGEMNVIENITNWDTRVLSYSTHYGKVGENVWEFHDTYGTYKNLYCVQSGSNLKKATYYSVYDLYNIDENTINTYFESEEAYHHFLYILENMYLVGRTGPDKTYMENSILSKIGHTEDYNEMKDEINTLNKEMGVRVGETDNAQFALYVGNDPSSTYITLDGRDNFLQVVQRYVLMHYVKQKDGKVGPDPINFNDWSSFIWTGYGYKKYVSSEYNNEKFDSAKNFANALIKMLERDFDDSTYDINKYKGFDRNDTYVTTDNATYDEPSNKIGPFTVVNPKGFEISVSKLKYGNTDIGYTIVDEDGNDVDLSGKTTEKTFYIKLNEQLDGSDSLSAQFHIDFGDIPTARIFIPKYENGTIKKDSQAMVNNEKRHDEKDVSWQTKVDTMKPDIALKKYIYAVNGSTDTVQPRLDSIDLTPLANETSTNAIYNMNKTPLKVRAGDTVTYAIQLFNEGEINGTAAEITDYLPGNMTFIRAYTDFNAANAPGYDGSSNINNCGTNNSIKLRNPNDYMTPYSTDDTEETFRAKSQIIYVDCKVGLSNKNYIYTNMAEITEYKMERGSDIDSDPSNWKQPSSDRKSSAWQNYSNNHSDENPTWFDNGFHNWGAQDNNGTGDDDDFDKVIIDNIDIALTKRIEGKLEEDGTETYLTPEGSIENVGKSYINITGFDEVKNGTADDLKYEMNKKVALVQREDKLVVAITVYNEGHLDGIVKQITDYLPQGLVFNPEKTAELYGVEPTYNESSLVVASGDNTITYTYDSRSRYLTMRLNTYRGIELKNLNEYDNDLNNHKVDQFEIKFIVDVSKSANGKLYNSAAITEYGYYGADGKYYSAWPAGVDKDSNAYVSDVQNLKFEHEEKHNSFENMSNDMTKIHKNNIQNQDDDDMDVVEVVYNPSFDLSLRKYIYQVEKDFDSSYENVNGDSSQGYRKFWENYNQRIPELDDESIDALKENGTAEYYHDKIKVKVETGNLVIYRMRVYNEGKNDDYYGRATEITDYLPEGLEFVALEDSSNHFGNKDEAYDSGWSADVEGNKIILTYSGEDATKILPVDSIETIVKIEKAKDIEYKLSQSQALTDEETEFYDTEYESYVNLNEKDYYQEVGVICRVTATPTDGEDAKIITNRAAITKHEAYEKIYSDESNRYDLELKQNVEDRDSQPDELTNPSLDYWYFNNVIDESTPLVYYPGEQDDDDFDTIYVNSYKLKIVKTDGKNNLPGVDLKVLKYRSISYPEQNFEAEELSDMETAIKDSGEGEKFFSAPANILENDVYIVKEIQSVNGYYNPFAGKYIKFSFRGDPTGSVEVNYQVVDYAPLMIEIYEDNGDDDYTNDNKIQYNHRDPDSIYDYVAIGAGNNSFTITIKNKKIEQEGKYTVKLAKYGKKSDGNVEQIGGVQFSALGKFNGESSVAIPHTGAIIESIADKYVDIIPDSYTDGYININPNTYETPDEIIINETGIRADAVDSEGHPINEKYYTGLLDKELKISINKTLAADVGKELYYVDSLDLSIDGESFTGRKTLDNGSEIDVNLVKRTPIPDSHGGTLGPTEAVIQVVIINPYIEKGGDYNLNLVKYKEGSNTPVAGVHFTATGHVNGKDVSFGDSDELIETGTSAVKIEENLEIEEDSIKDPDTYTFTEKDVGSNDDMYVGINQPIKLTVNKTTDKTDPSNWVYKVDSVTMEIGNESVETNGDGKTITLENGAEATIKYNSTTKTIELIVSNPKKTHEGDYSINIKKMGTDGRQLGGVVFETSGHFNGEDVGIPSATSNEITSLPSGTVNLMPDSFNGKVTIAGDNYEEADKVTFKETRINENAVDDQGNNVSGNYYLPIKDKVFELTINKDVKHEETKDIYYVSSLGLKVDGKTDNVTGSGFSYTYNDPNSEAKVTVTYNETNKTISVVVENPTIEKDGTYNVKLLKYKKGSTTPVPGVHFTAKTHVNGVDDTKSITTEETVVSIKDNATMSEEKINDDDTYEITEDDVGTNTDIYVGLEDLIKLTVKKGIDKSNDANWEYVVTEVTMKIGEESVIADGAGKTITLANGAEATIKYNSTSKTIELIVTNPEKKKEGSYSIYLTKTGTNGKQLGGVEFDVEGYINKETVTIPSANTKLVTDATDSVAVMPSEKSLIEIDPDNYETADTITLEETGLSNNAVDEDGNSVDRKYYLGFKNKEIVITINKDVDKTDEKKDVYFVSSIGVTIDGTAVPAKSGTTNTYEYIDSSTGATLTVSLNNTTNRIDIVVSNPEKTHEGDYSINIKKMGTDGRQLGGVVFETSGHFNGEDVGIPSATSNEITSLPSGTVNLMPDSFNGKVTIAGDNYEEADKVTFKETRIDENAVDDQGNAVSGNYYLPIKDKVFELTINKDVKHEETKDIYYVSSLGLKVDGKTDNVTGSGFSYTYNDPNSEAKVTVTYNETNRTTSVVVENPPIEREGTYHVKLVKYKKGSDTPVAGVEFTATATIDGEQKPIASDEKPLRTETSPISVKDNVPMSEENIGVDDVYTLKEKSVGTNSDIYIGYEGDIGLTVKKRMDTSNPAKKVFLVDKVSLTINNQIVEGNSITLDNGTKISVSYNEATKTIEIRVEDPLKEGKFKLNLIKHKYNVDEDNDGENDPLAGATFDITINDGTSDIKKVTNQVTDDEGKIPEIGNINITADDLTYTITVKEVNPPEGYIGLGAPVTFTAKSKFDGEKYVLDTQAQPQIENEYIQAEVNDDEILIETENRVEPVIHKGVKTVENQDSGYDKNEIQTWVINTSVPKGIKDYTVYNVTDTVDPEKKNNAEKRIAFMGEDNPGKNVVVKYKGTETILTEGKEYQVSFDTTTKQLKVTFINVTEGTDNFDGGRALEEDTILEITYKTQFTLDDNGDPIGLNQRIPNKATLEYNGNGADENKTKESEEPEVHTGGLGVYKFDKESNNALEGAKFRLVRTKEEANSAVAAAQEVALHGDYTAFNAIDWVKKYNEDGSSGDAWEITTDKNGYAYFAGLEFGEDAEKEGASPKNEGVNGAPIYNYDWSTASTTYYLIEVEVPYEYILLEQVAAESEVKKDSFVVTDLTKYHKVGNELVVPEGEYGLEILKYGKYEGEESKAIEGVIFSAKRTVNGQEEENLGDLTATDATGRTLVGDVVTIDKDQVDIDDVYTIHEESIPEESEYYVGLEKDIKLTVSKQSVKSEDKKKFLNSVTGISMTIEGENVTEVEAGKKYIATVVKDGQTLQVIAELKEDENGGQLINLTVENPHKVGQFPLHLIKTIKGTNPAQPLEEAGFKISIKDGNEYVKTTNGISIDGTHEYFTDKAGNILIEDIDIRKPGLTYSVEIEESTVPDKYIGIAGKITYTVTSVVDGNKLSLQAENDVVVTNDVKVEVKDGEIWNYVENKPEPVIHKGVKRIRNQDAGYDGDEIQTWVVNSTIPAGIEDYVQYIIDDEIDFEKQNVAEKRIEYIDNSVEVSIIEDYEGEKVKDLVPETDYLVDFDDSTKKLKITFIDVDNNEEGFKEGRKLPVGKIIEVKYKTKFRLDENGLIIGLQQIIKNKAFLTYGVKDTIRDQKKQSEEPEVHTGAVGVLKYEDVNKNGEFDDEDKVLEGAHFKIVKTEEEAKKALKAVLEDDEKTLSTINFIKTRDEEGRLTDIDVELITGEDGRASYQGLEFGEDADGKGENPTPDGQEEFLIYRYKDEWKDLYTEYYLVETEAPYNYYLLDHTTKFIVSMDSYSEIDLTKFYKEQNKPKIYDLSLRKFITHVNGEDRDGNKIDRNITDREPRVTLTDEFKDKENDKVTTAVYEHTKEPVIVQQGNIVTYTIRIYNEGPEDAYAAVVKDDIPDGVEFIPYTEGDGSVNDEYRWKLVDENDKPVSDISKAKYIITDYLSMEQGEVKDGVNENLLKGYDSDTMDKLDYRDLKVQFLVIEPNTSERIITNYAQISYMTNEDGKGLKDGIKVIDRDSTPNEWIDGEDDQDVEHIRLLYFDLALRKWVTKAKVTQDGQETVYETGHKAEDDPEDVVKVDLKKSKIDKVVVKFEYQIRITNEGRIGGWCEEITDHIPDGLVFEQADNPIWTVVDDKTIVTDVLKDTYLEPGESAEVTVVLRWVNSGDNLGIKVNIAEISKDRNEYGVHDIDSTPGNYKWGEDDIDDAPVMLAVTTGNMIVGYTILGLVVISIIAVGVVAVKKVRNEEQYF